MRGGTLFSGIGAPECAAPEIDWRWCAEIEPFPSAVHAARFPGVLNLGDVTRVNWDEIREREPIDILVFGSPCQSFSIAGKRGGLDDLRGNLTLIGLGIVGKLKPRWFIWENVPGVMSDDGGRTFGTVLGLMGQLGYGFAYRILDAQHFGVPQRRRRVFVVGHLGDWRPPAAVLFERESLSGHPAPRREAGQDVARSLTASTGGSDENDARDGRLIVGTLGAHHGNIRADDAWKGNLISHTLNAKGGSGRFDASEDGTGRGTPLVAFNNTGHGWWNASETATGLRDMSAGSGSQEATIIATGTSMVRRVTPVEAERLQGFPDGWTAITYRAKPAADVPRYRALGNAMAVPVMRWILSRVRMVNEMLRQGR